MGTRADVHVLWLQLRSTPRSRPCAFLLLYALLQLLPSLTELTMTKTILITSIVRRRLFQLKRPGPPQALLTE